MAPQSDVNEVFDGTLKLWRHVFCRRKELVLAPAYAFNLPPVCIEAGPLPKWYRVQNSPFSSNRRNTAS